MAIETPQTRYEAKYIVRLNMKLNKRTDADILAKLDSIQNKQGYIKQLIRADISGQKAPVNLTPTPAEIAETTGENYIYGMRLRGFAPGCQPKHGLVERRDDPTGRYHDLLVYRHELSAEVQKDYELDYIGRG